jgi:hypothetical protein
MYKATQSGVTKSRVLPQTEEDKQTVAEIFEELSAMRFLGMEKRDGIWQPPKNYIDGLIISDVADVIDLIDETE